MHVPPVHTVDEGVLIKAWLPTEHVGYELQYTAAGRQREKQKTFTAFLVLPSINKKVQLRVLPSAQQRFFGRRLLSIT